MTYSQKIYDVENKARKYICRKLDENNRIVLLEKEGEEYDCDSLVDLPCQLYIGKHYSVYGYYIVELYKDEEGYFAKGYDQEDNSFYEFNLFEELDSVVIADIADTLNS